MLSCSIWFSAPSFWMGGGLESRCVGRVYGADGALFIECTLILHLVHVLHWPDDGCFIAKTCGLDVIDISSL